MSVSAGDERRSTGPPICPICSSGAGVRWLLQKQGWQLYRCGACHHIFVYPWPSDEELGHLYSFASGYQVAGASKLAAPEEADPKFHERVERLRRHLASGSLLDVGCSYGRFLRLAARAGFEVEGVERSPDTAAVARSLGLRVRVGSLEEAAFPEGAFDAAHLGDVIEHVPDAAALLREVRRVLRPGGLLVLATPNHAAFFPRATYGLYRALRIPWSHATPPFHLHQFSTASLTKLLAHTGFEALEIFHTPVDLVYELRATESPSQLKRAVARRDPIGALRHGLASAAVLATYPVVWSVDRLLCYERPDASVTVIARAEGGEPTRVAQASAGR